ncbi:MAG: TIGR04283 family arsenosugar biosynthesis glycosyltransferase [Pseudomonadota bacterium]
MPKQISVIIPVFQEAKTIQHTLNHLCHLSSFEKLEIIMVDGETSRSTLRAIPQEAVIKLSGPKGRGAQMNYGASIATGNILLFLHADTLLPANAIKTILDAFASKNIMGGAFDLSIDAKGVFFRVIEAFVHIRTRIIRMPYGDQAIFIKKRCFHQLGGYPDIPIMEDVALIRKIKKRRQKTIIIPSPVKTSARRWKTEGRVYCTLRNWILLVLYSAGVSAEKIAKYYPRNSYEI